MFLSHGSYQCANVGFRCERGPFKQLRPWLTGKVLDSKRSSFETPKVITATAGPGAGRSMADIANMDIAELVKDPVYVGLVLGLLGIVVYFALGRKSFGPVPSKYRNITWAQRHMNTFQMTSPYTWSDVEDMQYLYGMLSEPNADKCCLYSLADNIGSLSAVPRMQVHKSSIGMRDVSGIKGKVRKEGSTLSTSICRESEGLWQDSRTIRPPHCGQPAQLCLLHTSGTSGVDKVGRNLRQDLQV